MGKQASILIFLLIFPAFSATLHADDDCSFVQMDLPGGSMEHVPVPFDDGLDMCSAFAASQMVDAWRFSHGDHDYDRHTSAIAAGLEDSLHDWTVRKDPRHGRFGMHPCDVVDSVRRLGACDDRVVVHDMTWTTALGTMQWALEFFDDYQRYHREQVLPWRLVDPPDPDDPPEARIERLANRAACSMQADFPRALAPDASVIERLFLRNSAVAYLDGVLAGKCVGASRYTPEGLPSCTRTLGLVGNRSKLNARLSRPHPQPVEVSICAELLKQGRAYHPPLLLARARASCGFHAALVIGRRRNPETGRCELRLRNSWGPYCTRYSPDWKCDAGNLWIDEDALLASTTDISYLEGD